MHSGVGTAVRSTTAIVTRDALAALGLVILTERHARATPIEIILAVASASLTGVETTVAFTEVNVIQHVPMDVLVLWKAIVSTA